MSGTNRLEGKTLTQAIKLLEDTSTVLCELEIKHALDAGTALGAIREQRLLPWDTDIDIAIDSSDAFKIPNLIEKLKRLGYIVKARYFQDSLPPFSKGQCRIIKVWTKKAFFLKGNVLLDIFVRYVSSEKVYWAYSPTQEQLIVNSMPSKYHLNTTEIELYQKKYLISHDFDGFLTFRYGNWHEPVENWDPFIMDGAIATRHPRVKT